MSVLVECIIIEFPLLNNNTFYYYRTTLLSIILSLLLLIIIYHFIFFALEKFFNNLTKQLRAKDILSTIVALKNKNSVAFSSLRLPSRVPVCITGFWVGISSPWQPNRDTVWASFCGWLPKRPACVVRLTALSTTMCVVVCLQSLKESLYNMGILCSKIVALSHVLHNIKKHRLACN